MSAELLEAPVPAQRPADFVELLARRQVFACPTGLHDICTPAARHDVVPESGLEG